MIINKLIISLYILSYIFGNRVEWFWMRLTSSGLIKCLSSFAHNSWKHCIKVKPVRVLWDSVQIRPWCFCRSLSADRWICSLTVSWWFECFSLYTNRAARSCHMWVTSLISPSVSVRLIHVSPLSLRCWGNNRSQTHSDSDTWHREPDQSH